MPGITYRKYYTALFTSQNDNLSDELYQKISKMKLTKSNISIMQESLSHQYNAFLQMQTGLKINMD
jgi:hypothetical protein